MTELVRYDIRDGSAWITLDRAEVRNALSFDTLGRLQEIVDDVRDNPQVRVVLITAAGEKAFSAGADLKERAGFDEAKTVAFVKRIGDVFTAVASLPQPTIAVLNGVAFGGGLELALACDMRIGADDISMGLTETSLAIIPGAGGTQRLPAVVGVARAKEMILASRRIDAVEACSIGLLNRAVPRPQLVAAAEELAGAIAANGPLAVRAAKEAIDLIGSGKSMDENLLRERELYLERVLPSADRLEALAAFKAKRKPVFTGT